MAYSFVSGATGGIGKAFCLELAKGGNDLFITARSDSRLAQLKDELQSYGVSVIYCACNLTEKEDRQALIQFAKDNGVRFNRIVNVAGVDIQKAFAEYTEDKVIMQTRVNFEATIHLTYSLLPLCDNLPEILTISSMSGANPMPYFALYSATKGALVSFFTSLHYELKGKAKVTVVMPGAVPTRDDVIQDIKGQGLWGKLSAKSPEFVVKKSLKAVNKNKIKYIPGGFNKFLYLIMKIAPKRVVLSFIANRWKKQQKDAF